ncbi:MAG: hypothetical protein WBA38_14490 [Gordonia sp. (in: high G+C Gram-positive bacteria)]|uniref:hypothetical protein n=1 Tax=Gordonia sp. (in: high G+C Gram-positive bacteria) TaxID=84139 RepID=UPI003C74EBF2
MRVKFHGGHFDGREHHVEPGATEARLPHLIDHGDGTSPDLVDERKSLLPRDALIERVPQCPDVAESLSY